ncbi:hypothetical protein GOV06_05320 [Candidatus Woesearchaeota archaeon]|nr:hypothetical protein [Candidatus Woesearchaeota archaeon]
MKDEVAERLQSRKIVDLEYVDPYFISHNAVLYGTSADLSAILSRKQGVRRILVLPAVLVNSGNYQRFVELSKKGGVDYQARHVLEITRRLLSQTGRDGESSELEEALQQLDINPNDKPELSDISYKSFKRIFEIYYEKPLI